MECRTLDLTIVSANGLEIEKKASVYAVAYISNTRGPVQKFKTTVQKTGVWHFPIKFTVSDLDGDTQNLVIKMKAVRMLLDKNLGQVRLPIKHLLEGATTEGKPSQNVGYQVAGNLVLNFTYKFGEVFIMKPLLECQDTSSSLLTDDNGVSHDGGS